MRMNQCTHGHLSCGLMTHSLATCDLEISFLFQLHIMYTMKLVHCRRTYVHTAIIIKNQDKNLMVSVAKKSD